MSRINISLIIKYVKVSNQSVMFWGLSSFSNIQWRDAVIKDIPRVPHICIINIIPKRALKLEVKANFRTCVAFGDSFHLRMIGFGTNYITAVETRQCEVRLAQRALDEYVLVVLLVILLKRVHFLVKKTRMCDLLKWKLRISYTISELKGIHFVLQFSFKKIS